MTLPQSLPHKVKELGQVIERYQALKQELSEFAAQFHMRELAEELKDERIRLDADALHQAVAERMDIEADIARFLEAQQGLSAEERAAVQGLMRPFAGVFRIEQRGGRLLQAHNLVDGLSHLLVVADAPASSLRSLERGFFIHAAARPLLDGWVLAQTPAPQVLAPSEELLARGLAAQIALQRPDLFLRSPERLAQARERQASEHARFVELFGAPWVEGNAEQVEAALQRYTGKQGRIPEDLRQQDSVAMVSHPAAGPFFVTDFARVLEALEQPVLAAGARHRDALLGLVDDEETPVSVLDTLAQERPAQLNEALAAALEQPDFDWAQHGPATLRARRPASWDADTPDVPALITLPEALLEGLAHLEAQNAAAEE